MLEIGWFSTGRGEGSRGLLKEVWSKIQSGWLKARISFVFCSREPGEAPGSDLFLEQVKQYNIPLIYFSHSRFRERRTVELGRRPSFSDLRLQYDRQVMKLLEGYRADLCVLAGYMLITGEEMCRKYNMINLHPAAPEGPAGTWQEVIWKLIEESATSSGVMMHQVTPELDSGPVITYCTYPVTGPKFDDLWQSLKNRNLSQVKAQESENNQLFKLIRQEGFKRELPLIMLTLKSFAGGKVKFQANKLVNQEGKPVRRYDLTREVEQYIAPLNS